MIKVKYEKEVLKKAVAILTMLSFLTAFSRENLS
jgi:hypothetical protein